MDQYPFSINLALESASRALSKSLSYPLSRVERYKAIVEAWLYVKQARNELNACIYRFSDSPRPTPSAERKLKISYIPIVNGKAHRIDYGLNDLGSIQFWLENGCNGMPAEELFKFGWHFDDLQRLVRERIIWDKMHLQILRELT